MSHEKEPQVHSPESNAERAESNAEQREKLKDLLEKAEREPGNDTNSLERLRSKVEEEAVSGREKSVGENAADKKEPTMRLDKATKDDTYRKTIKKVQHKLPRMQRSFSKFVHQPVVEAVSEVGSKTVARPPALLASGIFAFVGTSAIVWVSRYYGFRYNFFVYVAFLVGGFIAGLLFEALWRSVKRSPKQ